MAYALLWGIITGLLFGTGVGIAVFIIVLLLS